MLDVIRSAVRRDGFVVEAPAFGLSLFLAESFYKLQTFTLELLAFACTWYALRQLAVWIRQAANGRTRHTTAQ
jgi:hypothetical protein